MIYNLFQVLYQQDIKLANMIRNLALILVIQVLYQCKVN